jgi:predicted nuclease with TOPRIM domain
METTAQEIALMKLRMKSMEDKIDKLDEKLDMLTEKLLDPDHGVTARVNKNTYFRNEMEDLIGEIYAMRRWRKTTDILIKALIIAVTGGLVKIFLF